MEKAHDITEERVREIVREEVQAALSVEGETAAQLRLLRQRIIKGLQEVQNSWVSNLPKNQ